MRHARLHLGRGGTGISGQERDQPGTARTGVLRRRRMNDPAWNSGAVCSRPPDDLSKQEEPPNDEIYALSESNWLDSKAKEGSQITGAGRFLSNHLSVERQGRSGGSGQLRQNPQRRLEWYSMGGR